LENAKRLNQDNLSVNVNHNLWSGQMKNSLILNYNQILLRLKMGKKIDPTEMPEILEKLDIDIN
jgi:hypothetical protein